MEQQTKEELELERLEKLKQETNAEATERISRELQADKKLEERRRVVKGYFLELTGREMTEAEFILYNERFEKAQPGYNIKSFISELKNINN
jgi:hypothetical protein